MKKKTFLENLRDTLFYCGVTKEEYSSIKTDAYASNFSMWKGLHIILTIISALLFIWAMVSGEPSASLLTYSVLLIYSAVVTILFTLVLEPDSLFAQLLIYVTMIILLLSGLKLSLNQPDMMAVTFIVMLVMLPMFIIDKPYYMTLVLIIAACVYYTCIRTVKSDVALIADGVNLWVYTPMAILINIMYNSFRVRSLLMQKTIEHQRDTDELTGLMNKSALMRSIDAYIAEGKRGIMMSVDIDDFKRINDSYGHNCGDLVLHNIGECIRQIYAENVILGRFGGDEFVIYLPETTDMDAATKLAEAMISRVNAEIHTPSFRDTVCISVGLAQQNIGEQNYDTLFKKSDMALYLAKKTEKNTYAVYHE